MLIGGKMKKLNFKIIENNMGSQYHHYLLGIILQNKNNWKFVYNNYIGILVKHYANSHGDFCFDGIYSANHHILQELIIRGPLTDFHNTIKECLDHDLYVVMNINEQILPYRRAYNRYYFRHDVIIYGYDEEKQQYVTAGFDEETKYCEKWYAFEEIEKAYYAMLNEWDFEFFIFRYNDQYVVELDLPKIKKELEFFVEGKNPNSLELEDLFEKRIDTYYVNNSYKDYYGIEVYTYLIDRLKKQSKILKKKEVLCTNDLRTLNVLKTHLYIINRFINDEIKIENNHITLLSEEMIKIINNLHMISSLIIRYIGRSEEKKLKTAIKLLQKCKKEERIIINKILEIL